MGRVWMARDEMLNRDVAVKEFVPPDWMTEDEKNRLRDRTLREAQSAARLNHPHVVRIYDVVHAEGLPWIVMEYVPSRSLHQVISQDGPLPPVDVARIGLDILDALTAAHRAGVLHRDVKPHNVLIGGDGRVVLTDFGLATFVDDGSVDRARDGASTVESDLWSLGATLYAAVEGRSPYARESAMATLTALATDPPDPARLAGPLTPVLSGLLRHDPDDRLTAPQIEEQLRAIVGVPAKPPARPAIPVQRGPARGSIAQGSSAQRGPVGAPKAEVGEEPSKPPVVPVEMPSRRRSRLLIVAAAAVVLALLGGGGVYLMQRDESPPSLGAISSTAPTAPDSPSAPGVGGFSPVVCDAPATTAALRTPQPGAKKELDGWALLDGYSVYTDPSGFRVAVPDDWTYERIGTTVCFRDTRNLRMLSIDDARKPAGDPVQACRAEADRLVTMGALPGYQEHGIKAAPLAIKAADWEYSYDGPEQTRLHANTRWFASGGKAYAMGWMTREFEWSQNRSSIDFIEGSFKAG
jgi:serine/threonine protein kinase